MILCSNCKEQCGSGTIEVGAVVICAKCSRETQAANELLAAYARNEQDTYKTVLWLDRQAATQLEWSAKEAQL